MKQILCFGDSNTWGLVAGTMKRHSWNERWTGILQERLMNQDIRVIEEGLCGRTTVFEDERRGGRRGVDVFPVLLETHTPDLTVIMLGTNDCKAAYGATAEEIGQGIELLLDQLDRYAPESRTLLVSPIHLGSQVWKDEYDPEFNTESVRISRELKRVYGKIAGDHRIEFMAASDYACPSADDMEHLDKNGHLALADAMYRKISGLLMA